MLFLVFGRDRQRLVLQGDLDFLFLEARKIGLNVDVVAIFANVNAERGQLTAILLIAEEAAQHVVKVALAVLDRIGKTASN